MISVGCISSSAEERERGMHYYSARMKKKDFLHAKKSNPAIQNSKFESIRFQNGFWVPEIFSSSRLQAQGD